MKNKNFNGCFYGKQTPTQYEFAKERARNKAIDFQNLSANRDYYYGELVAFCDYFTKLGKRYGLLKEFRENGII